MEFARRGRPATADTGDGGRLFRDPPSHGYSSALVIRDALQAQLQKDRLRQEIIEAELAKIDRAIALRPCSLADVQQGKPPASSYSVTEEFIMPHRGVSGAAHDPKKKDGIHGGLESKPWNPFTEYRLGECSSSADGNAGQEIKFQESNETKHKQPRPCSLTWELTEVTLPVKRLKAPERWSCTVCQVEATSEHNLQQHLAGQKHQANVASFGSENNDHLHLRPPSAGGKPPLNGSSSNILSSEKGRPMMPLYFCKVCGVQCSDEATFRDRRRQKKHRAKARRQKVMTFFVRSANCSATAKRCLLTILLGRSTRKMQG